MTYYERVIDLVANSVIDRPYTAEEQANLEREIEINGLRETAAAEKAAARQALLDKLGITEDEARLLLS